MEHYVAPLPFKPKRWVTCHQTHTLEDGIGLMEVGIYLMKNLKKQAAQAKQGKSIRRGEQRST